MDSGLDTPLSLAGQFLIATPVVGGPPFDRSVVLLLEHDDAGAIGVIVNLPTDVEVTEHIPDLEAEVSPPGRIHIGGPVDNDTALLLGRSVTADFLRPAALGDVGLLDPDAIPGDLTGLRVYAGYAGWEPGQLEAELAEGAWWAITADRDDVFAEDVADTWDRSVSRAPGTIPFHRTFTARVHTN
jgi:putative transcriptional regulator